MTEIAVKEKKNGQAVAEQDSRFRTVNFDNLEKNFPEENNTTETPFDIMSTYWTPEVEGESKIVVFDRFDIQSILDQETGEIIDLNCAFFLTKEGGLITRISNGSKRLVGALESANIPNGAALKITYLGKRKNSTNTYSSDNWKVVPLELD